MLRVVFSHSLGKWLYSDTQLNHTELIRYFQLSLSFWKSLKCNRDFFSNSGPDSARIPSAFVLLVFVVWGFPVLPIVHISCFQLTFFGLLLSGDSWLAVWISLQACTGRCLARYRMILTVRFKTFLCETASCLTVCCADSKRINLVRVQSLRHQYSKARVSVSAVHSVLKRTNAL